MRPEDCKIPNFKKEDGFCYYDRLLFLAEVRDRTRPTPIPQVDFGSAPYFMTPRPLAVEYCAGNGQWICQKSMLSKEKNWIAVERKMARAKKIWSKIKNHNLANLLCLAGEALYSTKTLFQNNSLSEVYINFPDPWPKKRHHKHRLIQTPFLDELSRVMIPGAPLTIVTDCPLLSEAVLQDILEHKGFRSLLPSPHYITEWPDYGNSYFEMLWKEKGRIIRYHRFEKGSP